MPKNNQLLHEEQVSFNDYLNTLIENITVNFKKIKTHEECNQYFSDLSALHIKLGGTKILVQQVLDKIEDNMLSLCKKNNVLMAGPNKHKLSDISDNSFSENYLDSDLFNSNSDSDINENPLTVIPNQKKAAKNAKPVEAVQPSSAPEPAPEVKKTKRKKVAADQVKDPAKIPVKKSVAKVNKKKSDSE